MRRWQQGEVIVRRERLGLQPGGVQETQPVQGVWLGIPVHVVEDTPEHLVTFTGPGARFGFAPGPWPTDDGLHPWHERTTWTGEGCLMVQKPGDHYAVWHFWDRDRTLVCWYLNLQTDVVRHRLGYDTQDLELDIVVWPDGTWELKDDEVMEQRISDGRFGPELVDWVRAYGAELTVRLEQHGPWWDRSWAKWEPPPDWQDAALRGEWADGC